MAFGVYWDLGLPRNLTFAYWGFSRKSNMLLLKHFILETAVILPLKFPTKPLRLRNSADHSWEQWLYFSADDSCLAGSRSHPCDIYGKNVDDFKWTNGEWAEDKYHRLQGPAFSKGPGPAFEFAKKWCQRDCVHRTDGKASQQGWCIFDTYTTRSQARWKALRQHVATPKFNFSFKSNPF